MSKKFWRKRRVLLTGGAGFLGGRLFRELGRLKARVFSLKGDISDLPLIERMLSRQDVDTVFHMAAKATAGDAQENPLAAFEANIRGTWTILEACRRQKSVRYLIIASSCKVLAPISPLETSKACAEMLARTYFKTYGLPVCVARLSNCYGPGDRNVSRIIPGTILSVMNGKRPVIRASGRDRSQFLFLEDAVAGCLRLAEEMDRPEVRGEVFNFSPKRKFSVREIVEAVLRLMRREDLRPVILNAVKSRAVDQTLSAAKTLRLLGWSPSFTLEEGLRRTISWYENQGQTFHGAFPEFHKPSR